MGPGMRGLTVCPKDQPDLEIVLMPNTEGMMFTKESAEQMRTSSVKARLALGVFETPNIQATYEELKAKGVEFQKHQRKNSTVVEAIF
jgi:hypothetical protein